MQGDLELSQVILVHNHSKCVPCRERERVGGREGGMAYNHGRVYGGGYLN